MNSETRLNLRNPANNTNIGQEKATLQAALALPCSPVCEPTAERLAGRYRSQAHIDSYGSARPSKGVARRIHGAMIHSCGIWRGLTPSTRNTWLSVPTFAITIEIGHRAKI